MASVIVVCKSCCNCLKSAVYESSVHLLINELCLRNLLCFSASHHFLQNYSVMAKETLIETQNCCNQKLVWVSRVMVHISTIFDHFSIFAYLCVQLLFTRQQEPIQMSQMRILLTERDIVLSLLHKHYKQLTVTDYLATHLSHWRCKIRSHSS